MKKIILFCLIISSVRCYAQMGKTLSFGEHDFINKTCKAYFINQALPAGDEQTAVKELLYKQTGHFTNDNTDIDLENLTKGPYSRHYTFHQTYGNDIEIYNSQIKVNVDSSGHIRSIFDNSFDLSSWSPSLAQQAQSLDSLSITGVFLSRIKNVIGVAAHRIIFADTSTPVAGMYIMVRTAPPMRQAEYLVAADNHIIYTRDLTMYERTPYDSSVKVKVYYPDPITSGHAINDSTPGYNNNNYLDDPQLTNQEFLKSMFVHYDDTDGTLSLYNANYIAGHTVGSIGAVIPQVPTTASSFIFTRNNTMNGFLYSNTFFWLNLVRQHLDSTKYGNLITPGTYFDPMADSADNSDYNYGHLVGPNWFEFGLGGVPDAQDADVILHEHGHFVSYSLAPNSAAGFERTSVDEGQADFWAASYSRHISLYQADWVFNWDGHNQFWPGRICNTTAIYKNEQSGWVTTDIHINGQIWSTAMMDIWKQYGRSVAENLMLQANLSFAQNQSMPQCAALIKQADTFLYAGAHASGICAAFQSRGLYNGLCQPADTSSPYKITQTLQIVNTGDFASNKGNALIVSNEYIQGLSLKMYDVNGNLVGRYDNQSGSSFAISPKYLAAGVYIISVTTPNINKVFKVVRL